MHTPSARALLCVCALVAVPASAHELTCDETFDGQVVTVVSHYPATIQVSLTVTNVHPSDVSEALAVDSPFLSWLGIAFNAPFSLAVGASQTFTGSFEVSDFAACKRLAASFDGAEDTQLVSTTHVTWDLGSTQCSAVLVCAPVAVCQ